MTGLTRTDWRSHLHLAVFTAALALIALPIASRPANAFWIGFGAPFPGYYGPGPYWGYPAPYYPPPVAYYPPPSAYTPVAPAYGMAAPAYGAAAPAAAPAAAATTTPAITYTKKPAFTNSAGQTCREYKTTDGSHDVFGTACKQPDGQWRVTN